ncbi:MAG: hypothetical protein NC212_10370 [Staphylococcus sp.]|nr:hypothetical protein [Staphylococcus sp.]
MKKLLSVIAFAIVSVFAVYAGNELKTNYRTSLVLAYSPTNSIYEDDNLKLEIYNEKLWATNKTSKTIFIDLSQCFLIHNGSSYPMFDKEQNEKNASKKKVSTSVDEFISIAPSVGTKQNETFICNLGGGVYGKYSTTESPSGDFSPYEERLLTLLNELINESLEGDPKGKQYLGTASRHLTEDESISNIGASIAYAFNKRSEDWTSVAISTWVSDVYLAPYYVEMPVDLKKEQKRGFGVKKTEASKLHIKADTPFEFMEDKSPVIVCDWVGDFKKGTFSLNPTWVSKKKGMGFGKVLLASFATLATGGAGAALFVNNEETFYKKVVIFHGENSDWGKMSYFDNDDLSKFDNKR